MRDLRWSLRIWDWDPEERTTVGLMTLYHRLSSSLLLVLWLSTSGTGSRVVEGRCWEEGKIKISTRVKILPLSFFTGKLHNPPTTLTTGDPPKWVLMIIMMCFLFSFPKNFYVLFLCKTLATSGDLRISGNDLLGSVQWDSGNEISTS